MHVGLTPDAIIPIERSYELACCPLIAARSLVTESISSASLYPTVFERDCKKSSTVS